MLDLPDVTTATQYQFVVQRQAPPFTLSDLWPNMPLAQVVKSPPLAELRAAEQAIAAFQGLGDDWDGYGALAIDATTISNALLAVHILVRLVAMPDITPNPNGTLSFEWETSSGLAHLEIGKTKYSFYARPFASRPIIGDGLTAQLTMALSPIAGVVRAVVYPSHFRTAAMTPLIFSATHERRHYTTGV
jgi:hypothetical protein